MPRPIIVSAVTATCAIFRNNCLQQLALTSFLFCSCIVGLVAAVDSKVGGRIDRPTLFWFAFLAEDVAVAVLVLWENLVFQTTALCASALVKWVESSLDIACDVIDLFYLEYGGLLLSFLHLFDVLVDAGLLAYFDSWHDVTDVLLISVFALLGVLQMLKSVAVFDEVSHDCIVLWQRFTESRSFISDESIKCICSWELAQV